MNKTLRDYQQRIVRKTLSTDRDVVICLPTGGGKTVIANALIDGIGCQTTFVVPRLELIKQAKEEFGDADIIWADKTSIDGGRCIIASKDSLRTQYPKLPEEEKEKISGGVLIIDEAHVSLEQSRKLVEMINPARVIGLTATPERMDGQALLKGTDAIHKNGIFDELIQEETVPSLIRKGYLSKLRYYAKPIDGISEIKPDSSLSEELSGAQMVQIFNEYGIWGDMVESYRAYGAGRPALGFTATIEMAQQVAEVFQKAGYRFLVIHGGMPVNERNRMIAMLRDGEIDGLVNASLLTYGFDCPPVSYAFNCRHVKSRPLWFQIVGRILRRYEGKEDAVFVDHADAISEFSEPSCPLPILDEAIRWRVDGETREEKKERRRSMKEVRKMMDRIQALDPQPADLVEITMEDTTKRLLRIIDKLIEEKTILIKKNEEMAYEHDAEIWQIEQKHKAETREMGKTIDSEREKNRLIGQELEKKIRESKKFINSQGTYEYIRTHYAAYRRKAEAQGMDPSQAHRAAEERLRADESDLPFRYDKVKFENGMAYWQEYYK